MDLSFFKTPFLHGLMWSYQALVKCEENQIDSTTGEKCRVCTLYFLEWDPVTVQQVVKLMDP